MLLSCLWQHGAFIYIAHSGVSDLSAAALSPPCRSTQAATWFVMPFYQVYSEAGDFSVKNKCAIMSGPVHSCMGGRMLTLQWDLL